MFDLFAGVKITTALMVVVFLFYILQNPHILFENLGKKTSSPPPMDCPMTSVMDEAAVRRFCDEHYIQKRELNGRISTIETKQEGMESQIKDQYDQLRQDIRELRKIVLNMVS